MRIRYFPAKYNNLKEIDVINRASMPENYEPNFLAPVLSQHLSWIAKCDNAVVGYILIGTLNGELSVISLAIDAAFRGNGIGTELLRQGINNLKKNKANHGQLYLTVRTSNLVALKLYEQKGFVVKQVISDYYSNPQEDGVAMELTY